jgi:hypothetical protein
MSYSKLHSSIVGSSLWAEGDSVRLLFVTLLALCDRDGYVYGSRVGLERLANITVDLDDPADDPWAVLMSPDPESSDRLRAPELEGRRIEEVPGGFRLLNFEYYRGLRNDDDRKEQNRRAQEKYRKSARVSRDKPLVSGASSMSAASAHTDAEADTEADTEVSNTLSKRERDGARPNSLDEVRTYWDTGSERETRLAGDPRAFWDHFEACGWKLSNGRGSLMKNWKAAARNWARREKEVPR